jgi:hypothetical protein
MASFAPILDGEVLDINVLGAFSRLVGIHHFDGRLIVFVQRSRTMLRKTELGDSA